MPLEPIRRQEFADPDRMRVQDEAIASAENSTESHIAAYNADPRSFGGRYVAADLFKETFVDSYALSKETRNVFNTPVHNAAAVLSAEQFKRMLQIHDEPLRDTAVFLTGIPGAGKTSTVIGAGGIDTAVKVIFEGQLVKAETTIPKIQQSIDAGLSPVIIAVHAMPETPCETRSSASMKKVAVQASAPWRRSRAGCLTASRLCMLTLAMR